MTNVVLEPTDEDHVAARLIGSLAGERLVAFRSSDLVGTDLKHAVDSCSHIFIMEELAWRFPDDGVLSEEGVDGAARLGRRRVWIIDPLVCRPEMAADVIAIGRAD